MVKQVRGTLSEVARQCDVNQSTVSRVLNNSKHGRFSVSPEVRAKILKVANDLNYQPNIAARNLTVGKTRLVAVLGIADFWSDRVGPMEEAVGELSKALDKAGYEICVQVMSKRRGAFDLPSLRVDGILAACPRSLADLDHLERSGIPYVSMDGVAGNRGLQVVPDDADGVRQAVKYLMDLGHRRIAYLDNPEGEASQMSVFVRREAFAQASAELGFQIPVIDIPKLAMGTSWNLYYEPFLRCAVIRERATAVLAYSHFGALGLLRTAHDLGLMVPRDFSLMCFNNEPVLSLAVPSVTAVDVPSGAMGETAAALLLGEMEDRSPDIRSVKLPEKLVIRESTAPPAKSSSHP